MGSRPQVSLDSLSGSPHPPWTMTVARAPVMLMATAEPRVTIPQREGTVWDLVSRQQPHQLGSHHPNNHDDGSDRAGHSHQVVPEATRRLLNSSTTALWPVILESLCTPGCSSRSLGAQQYPTMTPSQGIAVKTQGLSLQCSPKWAPEATSSSRGGLRHLRQKPMPGSRGQEAWG